MNSPSSLRDLYNTSPTTWSFAPPSENATKSPMSSPPAGPSYVFSSPRPPQNSIFELSPGLAEPGGVDLKLLAKTLVASAFLQYTSTAIVMPWEVGKLLLQVQWVPRDAGEEQEEVVEEVEEELSDDSGEDSYFADPASSGPSRYPAPRPADERGYIVRKSVLEEGTRPEYVIPVGSADGVWGMIKRLGRFQNEGWLALWKGLLTSCITDLISSTLQPLVHGALQSLFTPSSLTSPYLFPGYTASLLLPVASHLITGLLLSPLDLVRTRLIAQSYSERHRTYTGPIDALKRIIREEGGIRGLYLHPHLLIPAVIDNTLRPLMSLGLPPLIAARFFPGALSPETSPVTWGVIEFVSTTVGLMASLPFETVRRRLQVQPRGTARPLRTCVETRPAPYNGVVDTMWHILTEERSDLPIRPRRRKSGKGKERADESAAEEDGEDIPESNWRHTGLGQLYRGLGVRVGASVIVFALGILSRGDDGDSGWAEL
ncbi:mitochondrial carrier domain-containing protein [Amylostereum chailletii]|nr:mitochondrial carrier domain-containing protein [Amylostereum chailletii]